MKNILLTFSLFFALSITSNLFGQTNSDTSTIDTTDSATKYIYCELLGHQKLLSTKVMVSVDYGQETTFFQDTRMKNEQTGKVQTFNSMVDALNYMGNYGWEFVQAYVVTIGQQNVYHWMLKKKK